MEMMVASMGDDKSEKSTEHVWKENVFFFEIRELILLLKKLIFQKTPCFMGITAVLLWLRAAMLYILSL